MVLQIFIEHSDWKNNMTDSDFECTRTCSLYKHLFNLDKVKEMLTLPTASGHTTMKKEYLCEDILDWMNEYVAFHTGELTTKSFWLSQRGSTVGVSEYRIE